jgi:hypothetical protein
MQTKSVPVYPWSDVAWDLAKAAGIDPQHVSDCLLQLTDEDTESEKKLLEQLNTDLATKLWVSLLTGEVPARDSNGKPLKLPLNPNCYHGQHTPFVSVADINIWLKKQNRLDEWKPLGASSGVPRLPRQWEQEQAVLNEIRNHGNDPRNLAPNKGGPAGLKSRINHALAKHSLFTGSTTFEKAWERLRAKGEIKERV